MNKARLLGLFLPLATGLAYGVLVLGYGRSLEAMAGGLPPFDLRALGYGLEQVRRYLDALSPAGVALYLGPVRWADTVFPVLMGLTFLWWMRPLAGLAGLVGGAAAVFYVALDLSENAAVAVMLRAGSDEVVAGQVTLASTLTQAKFAAFALAVVLTVVAFGRRRRMRRV